MRKTILLIIATVATTACYGQFDKIRLRVKERTLQNGMKFIVLERHSAPVVSFHVYADVGSANESYGITGISHLLEHMAFKGSKTVGGNDYKAEAQVLTKLDELYDELKREGRKIEPNEDKLAKMKADFENYRKQAKKYVINNEYFDLTMRQGDAGVNAYTSWDATQYTNSLPSNKLEFWMALTSDRFLNPVFREFYKEKDVVMEERRLSLESRPIGRLIEDFLATSFKAHPYHHSVVGHMSDLKNITRKDVADYFAKHYCPSNLTVAIVGDVNAEKVFSMAKLYFGRIPSGPKPAPVRTVEPKQWGERKVTVVAQSQPIIVVGYHRPAGSHPDDTALEALANIVGQGRSSRLYQVLVKDEKVAVDCGCFNGFPGQKFPNLIAFYVVPSKGHSCAECLTLIDAQIEKIKTEPVSSQELEKFKRTTKKSIVDQMKSNSKMAAMLTFSDVVLGDWRSMFAQVEQVENLTAADVKRVAVKYLVKKSRTIGEVVTEE